MNIRNTLTAITAAAMCALAAPVASCAGLGLPPAAIATADHVSLTTENALTVANDADDALILRVEAHVQAGDLHGADAARVRQAIVTIGQALDAADAAQRLGNNALAATKAGDAISLIASVSHDFPALAGALHH